MSESNLTNQQKFAKNEAFKIERLKQEISQLPFDKKLLILEQLQAEAFQKLLEINAQETKQEIEKPLDAWEILENMAGTVDAPTDWASEHDHYLYGIPKRNIGNE